MKPNEGGHRTPDCKTDAAFLERAGHAPAVIACCFRAVVDRHEQRIIHDGNRLQEGHVSTHLVNNKGAPCIEGSVNMLVHSEDTVSVLVHSEWTAVHRWASVVC